MGDVVRTDAWMGRTSQAAFGLATLTDNHGNSMSGFRMHCAGKAAQTINPVDWMNIIDGLSVGALRLDGVIPMVGDHPSPLQQFCQGGGVFGFLTR